MPLSEVNRQHLDCTLFLKLLAGVKFHGRCVSCLILQRGGDCVCNQPFCYFLSSVKTVDVGVVFVLVVFCCLVGFVVQFHGIKVLIAWLQLSEAGKLN